MIKSNSSTFFRTFLGIVLFLVVIGFSLSSSIRTVTAVTINAKALPTIKASSPRTITPANSTFGFYFGSNIPGQHRNATSTDPSHTATTPALNAKATPTINAKALSKTPALTSTDFLTPYHKGRALLNLGKYNESIAYFDKALSIVPKYFFALYNKGVALLNLGKYNESIAYFDKALSTEPNSFYALYSKGAALSKLGKYNESIAYFDKALAIEPGNSLALAGAKSDIAALSKKNNIGSHTAKISTKRGQTTRSIIPSLY